MKDIFDKPRLMLALDRADKLEALLKAHVLKIEQNFEALPEAEQEAVDSARSDIVSRLLRVIGMADDLREELLSLSKFGED